MKRNPDTAFISGNISKYKALAQRRLIALCANVFVGSDIFSGNAAPHEKLQIVYANIRV
ncbi:hypothetical protein LRS05_09160 [Flavobacterium sp. J372]|uniref:hypothetical protein n=1 Tax=Flavobacterium sp. J372 TaxID=2898436 RepID=UPI00215165D3|nr:hypothetical protein [Flavobacterium sp. J372]MCR5862303.1 hypothetical protein [Flavobacterium sp. J372]